MLPYMLVIVGARGYVINSDTFQHDCDASENIMHRKLDMFTTLYGKNTLIFDADSGTRTLNSEKAKAPEFSRSI